MPDLHILTAPVRFWACPSCQTKDRTQRHDAHTQMHNCPGLHGLAAPLVEVKDPYAKVDARQVVLERQDYAPDRIMGVRTDRGDGSNDVTIIPMTAHGTGRAS